MSGVVYHYFVVRGRGEVTRQLLGSHGVDFEGKYYNFSTWPEGKASGAYEFATLPVLEIDGHKLSTSIAIERYLAKKFGLYPADPYQAYLVDSIIDYRYDTFTKYAQLFWSKDEEALLNYITNDIKPRLAVIEARLVSNNGGDGFFVGEHKTWADYSIFQLIYDLFFLAGQEARKAVLAEVAPKVLAFTERFLASDAALQQHIATRSEAPI
jgi:glutathione S-transferase